jgi:hypothetical protein
MMNNFEGDDGQFDRQKQKGATLLHTNSLARICTEIAPLGLLQELLVIKKRNVRKFVCPFRIAHPSM